LLQPVFPYLFGNTLAVPFFPRLPFLCSALPLLGWCCAITVGMSSVGVGQTGLPTVASDTFDSTTIGPPQIPLPQLTNPQRANPPLEIPIERFRRSFYQGAEVLGGHLLDTGDRLGGLDMTFEEARVSFGVPLGSLDNILGIRPYFRATHLNGPIEIDVPGTLYETGITFLNQKTWSPRISTTLIVSPAVRSDLTTSEGALRIFGLGLLNYQCS
jgi:hypothetical protein